MIRGRPGRQVVGRAQPRWHEPFLEEIERPTLPSRLRRAPSVRVDPDFVPCTTTASQPETTMDKATSPAADESGDSSGVREINLSAASAAGSPADMPPGSPPPGDDLPEAEEWEGAWFLRADGGYDLHPKAPEEE